MESNKSVSEKLYTYLKGKYGVKGTELLNQNKIYPHQLQMIQIDIPNIGRNSENHKWFAILEIQDGNTKCLVIGEEYPSDNCAWSRYLEVKDNNYSLDHSFFHFAIMFLRKDFDFKTLKLFSDVLEDFVNS